MTEITVGKSGAKVYDLDGWNSVFGEHPGVFDALPLNAISENINDIITRHDSESKGFITRRLPF